MVILLNQIQTQLQQYVSTAAFFDAPTIAGLVAIINQTASERQETTDIVEALEELENLSEEEAQQLLARQLAQNLPEASIQDTVNTQDETFMRLAISQARRALQTEQVPIGACIVKTVK